MAQDRLSTEFQTQARYNEQIWSGFRKIEVSMIGAQSLGHMIGLLVGGIRNAFPRVNCATLACSDPEYEMLRIVELDSDHTLDPGAFFTVPTDTLSALFPHPYRPIIGPVEATARSLLFPEYKEPLGSIALAPLVLHGKLIGCLNQASQNARHFTKDTATDLLQHLTSVTAMCIENAVIHERLKVDGLTDALTHVANRRFFERRLSDEVERWLRRKEPLSCLIADIDYFKQINDKYGHHTGDQVLRQVAELLGKELRASDVLARYGGEEFVFLLPNASCMQAQEIAERLRANVEHSVKVEQKQEKTGITISIGVACLEPGATVTGSMPGDWLFKQADNAMYRAKQEGRNRVQVSV